MKLPSGSFASPNYPKNYGDNLHVRWLINGQDYVSISFPYFNTEENFDFARVYGGNSTSSPLLLEASGYDSSASKGYRGHYQHSVVSPTSEMLVVFNTDKSGARVGFQARYSSCLVLTSASGTISSPNYPNLYNNFDNVCRVINAPAGYVVSLFFNTFETQYLRDVLRVFDGHSTNATVLLSAGGIPTNDFPNPVTSSSNLMLIVFSSDYKDRAKGFEASYHIVLVG